MSIGRNRVLKPEKQTIENLIEIIKNSHVLGYESAEYIYNPIKENGEIDYETNIYTGHREITFHIQQVHRKGKNIISLDKTKET